MANPKKEKKVISVKKNKIKKEENVVISKRNSIEKQVDKLVDKYHERKVEEPSSFQKFTKRDDEVDDKSLKETATDEGLKQLFTKDNLEMKTELSAPLILAMSRGLIYRDYFKSKVMGDFINNIQLLSVSKGRKGRQEYVALVRNSQESEMFGGSPDMSSFAKLIGK